MEKHQEKNRIDAPRRSAEELAKREERLSLILESATDYAIFSMDMDGRIVTWNPGAERILGYSEGEAVGMSGSVIFVPEDRASGAPEREMEQAMASGSAADERWHVRKDGRRFWASGVMHAMRDHELSGYLKILRDMTAAKEAEEALKESEAHLRAILDAASVSILEEDFSAVASAIGSLGLASADELDAYLRSHPEFVRQLASQVQIIDANAEAMRRLGAATREELLGPLDRMLEPDSLDEFIGEITAFARGDANVVFESSRRALDGRRVEVRTTASFPPMTGRPGRVLVSALDITKRKRAEEARAESEGAFKAIFDNAAIGICDCLPETGQFIRANRRYCAITGYSEAELSERTIADVTHPDDYRRDLPDFERYLRGELADFDTVNRYIRKDGEIIWVNVQARLLLDAHGRATSSIAIVQDVTEGRRAEQTIRYQARLLDAVEQAVIATDLEGHIVHWNRYAEVLYGWSAREVLGRPIADVTPTEMSVALASEVMSLLSRGESWSGEFQVRRKDGSAFPAFVVDSPVYDEDGTLIGIVGISQDITDRKEVEERMRYAKETAEEANRMKSIFLANMSHEIRTPLTAILGFANLLGRVTEGKPLEYAERIGRSGKRLNETLDAVLTLARLEAGKVELVLENVHIAAEVRETADLYRREAQKKGLSLTVSIAPGAERARALVDRGAFTSVVQNLISNAVKFTSEGEVRAVVGVRGDRRCVQVHVEDTGIGISQEFMPHLFDQFTQESTGMSRSHEGAGLGLSLTRQLLDRMHGTIEVQSERGKGSRFTVTLPVAGDSLSTVRETVRSPQGGPHRVLVVEDHEDARVLIEEFLSHTVDVTSCSSGQQALELIRRDLEMDRPRFEAVLVDLNLGSGISGTELMMAIRATPGYERVPVAVITAYALPGDAERLLERGFDAYLRKPFTGEELTELASRLLFQRQQEL